MINSCLHTVKWGLHQNREHCQTVPLYFTVMVLLYIHKIYLYWTENRSQNFIWKYSEMKIHIFKFGHIWIKVCKGLCFETSFEIEQWVQTENCIMMLQISATSNDVQKKSVWVDLYSYVCYAMMIYGANKPITCVLRAYGKLN